MDTTLRDGEQTPNVSYTPSEKFQIAQLLLREIAVDRIEVASAHVSEGEVQAVQRITTWARKTRNHARKLTSPNVRGLRAGCAGGANPNVSIRICFALVQSAGSC